jgi:glutamate synthase (NADPH/NADH) small chain
MASDLLKFVDLAQEMPDKREAETRARDFLEIYDEFRSERAAEQASRCSQCGIPFCQIHCPLHNNIPDWLQLTAEGRLEEAYELAAATNNMPEICGRICPQDRLCEGNCVIEKGFQSVTIGSVERYVTETAFEQGWVRAPSPPLERPQSVGIIGAGPAGMAGAEQLRRKGYQIDVYDRYDRLGGLLMYGIPNFKLEKDVVDRRTGLLTDGGVRFHTDFEVGRDASLADLRQRHDAILIATGVYNSREIAVPGVGLDGIVQALTYLTASNRKGLGDAVPDFDDGTLDAAGKRVVVIGGGDTAMDCVRTAVRQGARSVKCLYRRDRENMPGSMREVGHAEEEGVDRSTRSDGSPKPRADRGLQPQHRGGPGDQGAGLRPGGRAGHVRRAGAGGQPLGHHPRQLRQHDDEPRWRLCRGRHHSRRLAGGLGGARRP